MYPYLKNANVNFVGYTKMVNVRDKGQRGEREFLGLLSELLELEVSLTRNLSQTRGGGADCIELPGYSIEVKNCATVTLSSWWKQATRQAQLSQSIPILAYKVPRKGWLIVCPFCWLLNAENSEYPELLDTVQMGVKNWVKLYKIKRGLD